MNQGQYVFSQLIRFLDRNHFNYLVRKYGGDHYVKHFRSARRGSMLRELDEDEEKIANGGKKYYYLGSDGYGQRDGSIREVVLTPQEYKEWVSDRWSPELYLNKSDLYYSTYID